MATVDQLQLVRFLWTDRDQLHLFEIKKTFNDVLSNAICTLLCTDVEDRDIIVNAWIYSGSTDRSCKCVLVESQLCGEDIGDLHRITPDIIDQEDVSDWLTVALSKDVSYQPQCLGKKESIKYFWA